jgi:hypothetical protein
MGGLGGEIRGPNRDGVWARFCNEVRPFVIDRFGLFEEAPGSQQRAYDSMKLDHDTGEWVLEYYFGK